MEREQHIKAAGRHWVIHWTSALVNHDRWYAVTTCVVSTRDENVNSQVVVMGAAHCAHGDVFNYGYGLELSFKRATQFLECSAVLVRA